jgi:hypothetical protein
LTAASTTHPKTTTTAKPIVAQTASFDRDNSNAATLGRIASTAALALGQSRGGLTSKIHRVVDVNGLPVRIAGVDTIESCFLSFPKPLHPNVGFLAGLDL